MSELEKQEFSKIMKAATDEDQMILAKHIKSEILLAELERRIRKMEMAIGIAEKALISCKNCEVDNYDEDKA